MLGRLARPGPNIIFFTARVKDDNLIYYLIRSLNSSSRSTLLSLGLCDTGKNK